DRGVGGQRPDWQERLEPGEGGGVGVHGAGGGRESGKGARAHRGRRGGKAPGTESGEAGRSARAGDSRTSGSVTHGRSQAGAWVAELCSVLRPLRSVSRARCIAGSAVHRYRARESLLGSLGRPWSCCLCLVFAFLFLFFFFFFKQKTAYEIGQ